MPRGDAPTPRTVRLPHAGPGDTYAPPSAARRAFLTAASAAGLTGLWAGYAAVITPLLTGADAHARDRAVLEPAGPPEKARPLAERWLGHAAWAADSDWRVGSGAGTMYWNTWRIIRDGRAMEVTPFAAVFTDDAGPGEAPGRPTTLVAERAVLRFDKTVSEDGVGSPGRVVAAIFTGAVRVDGADGLRVDGTDFVYRETSEKLWSDRPATFAHGGHAGRGRSVEVELFRTGPATGYGSFAADGIARVEVGGPVEVDLKAGAFPGLDAAGDEPKPDDANAPPVHIAGTGPFAFDPHANTARFLSARGEGAGVRVWRDHVPAAGDDGDGEAFGPDDLTCQTLTVRLEPDTAEARAEADAMRLDRQRRTWGDRNFFAADGDLAPVAVLAEGPRETPVRVSSPSRGVAVVAGRLEHDLPADVLTLDSANAANGGMVTVIAPDARVRCPRVVVSPPDPATPDGPRRVSATGPGELNRNDPATGAPAARVTWPGTLVTGRDAATGRDTVTLTGRADAPRDDGGHTAPADQVILTQHAEGVKLSGDVVRLHLEPAPDGGGRAKVGGAAGDANPLGGSVRPAFAEAVGSVRMTGPQLIAGAQRMGVAFEDAAVPEPVFVVTEPATKPKRARPAKPQAGERGPKRAPAVVAEVAPVPDAPAEPQPVGPPAKFYADRVDAAVVRAREVNGKEAAPAFVRFAEAVGNVGLDRVDDDGAPQYARAARAEVTATGPADRTLSLFGSPGTAAAAARPATLGGSDAVLTGPRIDFDPAANTAVVVGGGAIDLPIKGGGMPAFAPGGAGGAQPRPAPPAGPAGDRTVRVQWGERMTFDGAVAVFEGDARTTFHGTTPGSVVEDVVGLSCERMTVTLTKPVVFGDGLPGADGKPERKADDDGEAPAVELITCSGTVRVSGYQTAPDPRRPAAGPTEAQRIRGNFAQLTVQWETGDFTAEGPGRLRVWRRDDAVGARPTAGVTVRSNPRRSRKRVALPCELIDVAFTREVAGNLDGPDAVFHPGADGPVRVVHGPVADFGRDLDPNALPAGGAVMACRRVELDHDPDPAGGAAKTRTLLAGGDVELDGRTEWGYFNALGPQAAYNEAKGKLRIFGTRPDSVQFFRSATVHGERTQVTTKSATFFPDRNHLVLDELSGADALP